MNGNPRWLTLLMACCCALDVMSARGADITNTSGVLQFFDGSTLHGRLREIDPAKGLTWQHPAGKSPIQFRPNNVATIQFEQFTPANAATNSVCRFRFLNGDEILGNIKALKEGSLDFETWFGSNLKAPQQALEAIQFSSKGFAVFYEGPRGPDGWTVGRGPKAWAYKDGAFVSNGPDFLGRDMRLSGNSLFAFDLSWRGSFSLSLTMFTDTIDRFDYNSSSYMLFFGVGAVSVQRVQPGVGAVMFGQAQIPSMLRKSKMRFEIRANKDEGTLTLLADGVLIQKWRDNSGFNGKGTGVVFCSQMEGTNLRINNVRAAEWSGNLELDEPNMTKDDILFLANRDRASGKLESISNGKVVFSTVGANLEIPLTRITQIQLASPRTNRMVIEPWYMKARFSAGEAVSIKLAKWETDKVTGFSPNFGSVNFKPESIKELQLNLERPRPAASSDTILTDENLLQPDE